MRPRRVPLAPVSRRAKLSSRGSRLRQKPACNTVAYEVVFRDEARSAFLSLDSVVRKRIMKVIERLAEIRTPVRATRLVSDLGTWRVRAGDWRILYEVNDDRLIILILDVGHRSKIY
jgi:mRNA interferase RelE/StbE